MTAYPRHIASKDPNISSSAVLRFENVYRRRDICTVEYFFVFRPSCCERNRIPDTFFTSQTQRIELKVTLLA